MICSFLLFSENKSLNASEESSESIVKQIKILTQNKDYVNKYKYFAVNICAELLDIIDNMKNKIMGVEGKQSIEEMRKNLKMICIDVENLADN